MHPLPWRTARKWGMTRGQEIYYTRKIGIAQTFFHYPKIRYIFLEIEIAKKKRAFHTNSTNQKSTFPPYVMWLLWFGGDNRKQEKGKGETTPHRKYTTCLQGMTNALSLFLLARSNIHLHVNGNSQRNAHFHRRLEHICVTSANFHFSWNNLSPLHPLPFMLLLFHGSLFLHLAWIVFL